MLLVLGGIHEKGNRDAINNNLEIFKEYARTEYVRVYVASLESDTLSILEMFSPLIN